MKRLIYIVDDSIEMLEIYQQIFCEKFKLETFSDPIKAREAIKTTSRVPDIIITDYSMPNLTGIQLLNEVQDFIPQNTKIFIISSDSLSDADFYSIRLRYEIISKNNFIMNYQSIVLKISS